MDRWGLYSESDEGSTPSSVDLPIPTHSTRSDSTILGNANTVEEVVPWPGERVMIWTKDTALATVLVAGKLEVRGDITEHRGFEWECVENDGWLGFRNTVSGT